MKKRWLVLGLGLSLTMSSVTFPMEKNVVLASEVGSESDEEVTEEGFLANLTVEAYGRDQVIIKNVSEDVKTKLQKCVWNRKGISADQTVDFKVKGTDLILKNCSLVSGDSLILSNKAEKLKKEFGPFQSNPKNIYALSEGQFLGWDSEEKAIIGLDDTMEYQKYDWYSHDRGEWMPVQGGKLSVDRYSGDIDKEFEIRYAAKGYTFASGTKRISGRSDIFYQPEWIYDGEPLKGMAFRIEDVETSPQAVVDYTLFEGKISDFQYKKTKAGEGSFEEDGYTDFQVPTDGKVIKLPIKRGEILWVRNKNTKIGFLLPFHEGGKLGTKFYHLSPTGKEMYVNTSKFSVFEYKEKGESVWKKVTRDKIQTGYDGSHARTLTFRSRAWGTDFTEERDITIDPESNYFKYDRHADLKATPLEIRLIEKKVVIQELTGNRQSYQYKLVAENDVSDEGFTNFPEPSGEHQELIELPLAVSDIKELENRKLVIKTTYGTKTAIHFKPHTKEKFFGTLRQIPNTTRVEGIDPAFEIRKKGEDVSSAKIAYGSSSEKTPGTYLIRYPEYEDDLGELQMLRSNDGGVSPSYGRAIITKFGYERDDLDIYLPGGEFEFEIKPADQVKPEEGNNQGNGNSGSGNTGGGSTGGTTPPSTNPGTDSGNSGSGNTGGGSTGGSATPPSTTPGTDSGNSGSGNAGGGSTGGGSTGGSTTTPSTGSGSTTSNSGNSSSVTTATNTDTKKEEVKKEEIGKTEAKQEEPKVKESKEEVKPEVEVVKETKKTKILASEEKVSNVLESENGKLSLVLKKAKVVLDKAVIESIFGEKAGKLEVSVKAKTPKKKSKEVASITKALKGEKVLVSKTVINLGLKADGKALKASKLNGKKITVSLSLKLGKVPKTIYVMDVKTGKLIKAKYDKKTKTLSFKTNKLGEFVVVKKRK